MDVRMAPLLVGFMLLAVFLFGLIQWFLTKPADGSWEYSAMPDGRPDDAPEAMPQPQR